MGARGYSPNLPFCLPKILNAPTIGWLFGGKKYLLTVS